MPSNHKKHSKTMKKVSKYIVYILFGFIAIPFVSIYFTIKVIYNFLDSIYDILCDLEEKILSINKINRQEPFKKNKI